MAYFALVILAVQPLVAGDLELTIRPHTDRVARQQSPTDQDAIRLPAIVEGFRVGERPIDTARPPDWGKETYPPLF